jgi:hypothetical protein
VTVYSARLAYDNFNAVGKNIGFIIYLVALSIRSTATHSSMYKVDHSIDIYTMGRRHVKVQQLDRVSGI